MSSMSTIPPSPLYSPGRGSKLTNKRSAEENPTRTEVLGFFKIKSILKISNDATKI